MIILNDDHKKDENKIMIKTTEKMTEKMTTVENHYEIRSYKVANKIDNIWMIDWSSFNNRSLEVIDDLLSKIIDDLFSLDNSIELIEIVYIRDNSESPIISKFRED